MVVNYRLLYKNKAGSQLLRKTYQTEYIAYLRKAYQTLYKTK